MITDKKALFRAIGDIDDKYITEVLSEDAKGSGKVVKMPLSQRPVIKYMKYYLPAAAALLIVVVCIKSGVFSPGGTYSADTAAPAAGSNGYAAEAAPEAEEEAKTDTFSPNSPTYAFEGAVSEAADSDMNAEYAENAAQGDDDASLGMPNPFIDCDDLEEAEEIAGFDFNVPNDLEPDLTAVYQAIEGNLIQIIYYDGDREVYRIRKGTSRDVSGDYKTYSVSASIDSAYWAGELKGDEEGMTSTAIWVDDEGYGYSLTTGDEPLSTESVCEIIDRLME